MEKRWLGSIGLILVLVLLVFAVGYSSGNSVTGYQFFNIFKKNPSVVPSAEREPLPVSSRCCTLTYFGLDSSGRAAVDINGRDVFIDEGESGLVNGCQVEFHQADGRTGDNARFTLEGEEYTLDSNDQFSAGDCSDASCCTMLYVGLDRRGRALVEVNGQSASLGRGQRRDVNNCNVEFLGSDRYGGSAEFRLQGDNLYLETLSASSEGSSCNPCAEICDPCVAEFNTLF